MKPPMSEVQYGIPDNSKFSAAGMELLKRSEGFRDHVYLDVAGIPTVGYGHKLIHPESFPNGVDEPEAALIRGPVVPPAR